MLDFVLILGYMDLELCWDALEDWKVIIECTVLIKAQNVEECKEKAKPIIDEYKEKHNFDDANQNYVIVNIYPLVGLDEVSQLIKSLPSTKYQKEVVKNVVKEKEIFTLSNGMQITEERRDVDGNSIWKVPDPDNPDNFLYLYQWEIDERGLR